MQAYVGERDLSLVHVEVVDDDTDEQVESEKRPEYDEQNKIQVHHRLVFQFRLLIRLQSLIITKHCDVTEIQILPQMKLKQLKVTQKPFRK